MAGERPPLDCGQKPLWGKRGGGGGGADAGASGREVRLGTTFGDVAAGEPVDHNDDMFGSTVNLASRICAAADAGHDNLAAVAFDLAVG